MPIIYLLLIWKEKEKGSNAYEIIPSAHTVFEIILYAHDSVYYVYITYDLCITTVNISRKKTKHTYAFLLIIMSNYLREAFSYNATNVS